MEQFLAGMGLCAMAVSILVIMKKVDDYRYLKKLRAVHCKIDEDEEE